MSQSPSIQQDEEGEQTGGPVHYYCQNPRLRQLPHGPPNRKSAAPCITRPCSRGAPMAGPPAPSDRAQLSYF